MLTRQKQLCQLAKLRNLSGANCANTIGYKGYQNLINYKAFESWHPEARQVFVVKVMDIC